MRRRVILLLAVALPFLPTEPAAAQGTLRIGIALSPKVKGFVQPQSWFVDLTAVTVR